MQFLRSVLGSGTAPTASSSGSGPDPTHQSDGDRPTPSSPSRGPKQQPTTSAKLAKYMKLLYPLGIFEEDAELYKDLLRTTSDSYGDQSYSVYSVSSGSILSRIVDLRELGQLLWSGAPEEYPGIRATTWRLLLGIAPNARDRHFSTLSRKRREYHDMVRQFHSPNAASEEQALSRQIRVDLPRTSAGSLHALFQHERLHSLMERILFVWAVRHPACGYVQGINDLLTPFLVVLLAEKHLRKKTAADVEGASGNEPTFRYSELDIDAFSAEELADVEADAFLCLSKFVDGIQDLYTPGQPGIQRMLQALKTLLRRTNHPLAQHLEDTGVELLQVTFRWFNCLLAREMPIECVIRLWDTYISELHDHASEFDQFLTFFVATFLTTWEKELLSATDFQQVIMFLQKLPTANWTVWNLELLLTQCHIMREGFAGAHEKAELMKSLRLPAVMS